MNSIQNNLQNAFQEYQDLKEYIIESTKKPLEERKKEVADKALEKETFEEQMQCYFEEFGESNILGIDFLELQRKLYYTYLAYKDLIEVPENIKKEIEDLKIGTVFSIIGGKKEITNKELYEKYRQQHLQHAKQEKERNEGV